jgi:hypothetical protein
MARGVDQIQDVRLAILRLVVEPDRMGLNGNATLAFEVHVVEYLCRHVAAGHGAGQLQQTICQSRLAVIDVGDDREIAYAGKIQWTLNFVHCALYFVREIDVQISKTRSTKFQVQSSSYYLRLTIH